MRVNVFSWHSNKKAIELRLHSSVPSSFDCLFFLGSKAGLLAGGGGAGYDFCEGGTRGWATGFELIGLIYAGFDIPIGIGPFAGGLLDFFRRLGDRLKSFFSTDSSLVCLRPASSAKIYNWKKPIIPIRVGWISNNMVANALIRSSRLLISK